MAKNNRDNEDASPLKGIAADILREVIKADMSMHSAQIDAWQWIAKHRPKGEYINDDIYEGFARNLYLSLSELKLQWHVKPVPLNFWRRFKLAFKVLFHGAITLNQKPVVLEMTSASDPEAMLVNLTVNRYKDGTVKATYTPVDTITENLLKK